MHWINDADNIRKIPFEEPIFLSTNPITKDNTQPKTPKTAFDHPILFIPAKHVANAFKMNNLVFRNNLKYIQNNYNYAIKFKPN